MLSLLVAHGADLTLMDGRNRTVIGWAKKNNIAMIEWIQKQIYKKNNDQVANKV